ncbi:MAG TPA: threonine synthase, partial [Magnetospirillaceae bacterium]|nr:threonine synthase [Magnetospirillaceae bacterium]
ETFPPLSDTALDPDLPYAERALAVLEPFFRGDALEPRLADICRNAFDFPVPLVRLSDRVLVLELFHGPTAAFKDFGARFLANALERLQSGEKRPLDILAATSGDTGGAVAAAFHLREGIRVRILFPDGGVSGRQRKQLTCWGDNVSAYSVRGTFDDCQRLVKEAFRNPGIGRLYRLTSANSINLGRLLPQTVYYVHAAVRHLAETGRGPTLVVPSGNVGNAVGAYWARAMGAPIARIALAVNANRTLPDFLTEGVYRPRPSVRTLANAMDVGDPSNLERLRFLFPDMDAMRRNVCARSVTDGEIRETIRGTFETTGYTLCPHTATAEHVRARRLPDTPAIVVATAHPAKFELVVEPLIGRPVPVPESLLSIMAAESRCESIEPRLEDLFPETREPTAHGP